MVDLRDAADPTAWIIEVAAKLTYDYAANEAAHLERGAWQLNVIDGQRPSPHAVELGAPVSMLGRSATVWALPATRDTFAAHHLDAPLPIDCSGVVLFQRAWVGVDPTHTSALTVVTGYPAAPATRPVGQVPFPIVPALVGYAVPRDEGQDPQVLVQFLCSVREAQAARVLPSPLPVDVSVVEEQAPRGAAPLVRRLPASSVRTLGDGSAAPVAKLRYALHGSSGLTLANSRAALDMATASLYLATLVDAVDLAEELAPDERELCWSSALDAAGEVLDHATWSALRADQAGPRNVGHWVQEKFAAQCGDDALFASLLLDVLPHPANLAHAFVSRAEPGQLSQACAAAPPIVLCWLKERRRS